MAGQGRITRGVSTPGGDVQFNETDKPLVWQSELDIAIDDIDARLKRPRRRVTDEPAAQNSQPAITSEQIDEIAWRVTPPPALAPPEPKRLPDGIAITIRVRRPFFRLPWPFRRRRRQAMIMFSDYRIT